MLKRFRSWLASKLDPEQYAEPKVVQRYVEVHQYRLTRPVFNDYKDKLNVSLFVTSGMSEQEVAWRAGVNYAIAVLEKLYVQAAS